MALSSKRVRYKAGDIFCIPLPDGSFGYGRILLDVFRVRQHRIFDSRCGLNGIYGSGLLVQLYRYATAKPLADVTNLLEAETFLDEFLAHDHIRLGEHLIIGHIPVAPADLDFPEYVHTYGPTRGEWQIYFGKGGVVAELSKGWHTLLRGVLHDVDYSEVEKLPRGGYGLGIHTGHLLTQIHSPTGILDRARHDLRASPQRKRILRLAGFSLGMTYDQMATRAKAPQAEELLAILSSK